MFIEFLKKSLIELICVSPIPSIFDRYLIFFLFESLKKLRADFKCLARSFAFS